jgi:type I restriction enzyme S subunit
LDRNDQILGLVPDEWNVGPLGRVLTSIDAGRSPDLPDRPARTDEWGVLKVSAVRPDGLQETENKVVIQPSLIDPSIEVKDGDLLVSRANTPALVGLACYVRKPRAGLMLSDKTLRLAIDSRLALPQFVSYLLQAPFSRRQIETSGTGSSGSMKNISQDEIRSLVLPLPGIQEQYRLAEILGTADEMIRATESLLAKLERTGRGLLHDVITRGIDTSGQLRDSSKNSGQLIEAQPGYMPKTWRVIPAGDLFEIQLGKMLDTKSFGTGLKQEYLTNRNIQWQRILLDDLERMPFSEAEVEKFSLEDGDVLVCEGGEVGRCAVWRHGDLPILYQKAIHRLRTNGQIEPDFFVLYMLWLASYNGFSDLVGQTSIAHLPKEKLAILPVRVPGLAEQRRILAATSTHGRSIALEEARLSKLRSVKQGLMDDLLTGRIRVGLLA